MNAQQGTKSAASVRPRVAVSGCIAGEAVRFDGGHGRNVFGGEVAKAVDVVSFCPEVEAGMGVPRETIRLVRRTQGAEPVALANRTGDDWTDRLVQTSQAIADRLAKADLSGVVVRRGSPTCGLERVRVYDPNGVPSKEGVGLFVQVLRERLPLLAIEEDGRLNDPRLREAFFERVFADARLRALLDADTWTRGDVVAFHSREKLLLLSHKPWTYQQLGRLVARISSLPRSVFADEYRSMFLSALAEPSSTGLQVNALQHAAGFLSGSASASHRAAVTSSIDDYAGGLVPLSVPVAVLSADPSCQPPWLASQSWLAPHPKALRLRNWTP